MSRQQDTVSTVRKCVSEYLGHRHGKHDNNRYTVEFKSYRKFELLRVKLVRKWTGWVEFMGGLSY